MACSSPLYRFNEYTHSYSRIPCGWCMSCRIDKRTYHQDRIEYAYFKDFGAIGTFGCITYDDNHVPTNEDGDIMSLRKSDMQKFWKRVRSYMKYHKIDNHFLRSDFKHYTVGEYSPDDMRPHYHFIAVGLDFRMAEDLYRNCWNKAVVFDSKPIEDGGIAYVLKYLDKQQHGDQLDEFIDNGIEPPFMINSHCIGSGLFSPDNIDFVNQTYRWNNKNRPLPPWVKAVLCLPKQKFELNSTVNDFAKSNNISYDEADRFLRIGKNRLLEQRTLNNNEPLNRSYVYSNTSIRLQLPIHFGNQGKGVFTL